MLTSTERERHTMSIVLPSTYAKNFESLANVCHLHHQYHFFLYHGSVNIRIAQRRGTAVYPYHKRHEDEKEQPCTATLPHLPPTTHTPTCILPITCTTSPRDPTTQLTCPDPTRTQNHVATIPTTKRRTPNPAPFTDQALRTDPPKQNIGDTSNQSKHHSQKDHRARAVSRRRRADTFISIFRLLRGRRAGRSGLQKKRGRENENVLGRGRRRGRRRGRKIERETETEEENGIEEETGKGRADTYHHHPDPPSGTTIPATKCVRSNTPPTPTPSNTTPNFTTGKDIVLLLRLKEPVYHGLLHTTPTTKPPSLAKRLPSTNPPTNPPPTPPPPQPQPST